MPSKSKYKAVFFDWGGVLSPGGRSFLDYIESLYDQKLSEDARQYFREGVGELNKGTFGYREFLEKFEKLFSISSNKGEYRFEIPPELLSIYPQLLQYSSTLRARDIKTGIISNVNHDSAKAIEASGGYKDFDPLILSCRVSVIKPSPEIFHLALKQANVLPEEAIFVDDKQVILDGAVQVGMQAVLAITPEQTIEDLKRLLG